jgi:hypothetical protein
MASYEISCANCHCGVAFIDRKDKTKYLVPCIRCNHLNQIRRVPVHKLNGGVAMKLTGPAGAPLRLAMECVKIVHSCVECGFEQEKEMYNPDEIGADNDFEVGCSNCGHCEIIYSTHFNYVYEDGQDVPMIGTVIPSSGRYIDIWKISSRYMK